MQDDYVGVCGRCGCFGCFVRNCLRRSVDAEDCDTGAPSTDWRPYLRRIGANDALLNAICSGPQHSGIANTGSCADWVDAAIKWRWEWLLVVYGAQKIPEQGLADTFAYVKDDACAHASSSAQLNHPFTDTTYDRATMSCKTFSSNQELDTIPLWRAETRVRAEGMWHGPRRTGRFNVHTMHISELPRSDFSLMNTGQCWTPDLEAAKMYAAFFKAIAAPSEICLVRFEFPKSLLEQQTIKVLQYPDEEWKRVVYYCRRTCGGHWPIHLRDELIERATLLIGDIATGTSCDSVHLNRWEQFSDWHLLKLKSGQVATQYVFGHMRANYDLVDSLNRLESNFTIHHAEHPNQLLPPLDIFNESTSASSLARIVLSHSPFYAPPR